jgi:hypothetical protein
MNKNITIVTGLWDLGRGNIDGWAKRDFNYYKTKFFELLESDAQMCIWVPDYLVDEVEKIRKDKPTKIFIKNLKDFEIWNPFFREIQEIRNNPDWINLSGWLRESPQALLEYYNPMMFTKMFMVNDSAIINPFNSEYFFWIDGGLTTTVSKGYFHNDLVLDNLENYCLQNSDKFIQISYPYESNNEIHGFERNQMAKYCNTDFVKYVCRGGFFGGSKEIIHKINSLYYDIMYTTLNDGYMGADECLFTILSYKNSEITHRFEIEGNGLVWPFFENLKKFRNENFKNLKISNSDSNVGLYVITFNSPKQFETLIESIYQFDENFIKKTKKFLLDNSTDISTSDKYIELCEKNNFEYIKKDNLGICGGRQWISEHFENQKDLDYYLFFEDDMFFHKEKNEKCRNGFSRYSNNFFNSVIEIIKKENFDFLKLNFSEFYGDNGTQWSWYNVPQNIREKFWSNYSSLPKTGIDPNAPKTKFDVIKSHNGIPYANGEIYYSNWPQIVSRNGNKKMFLDTKWTHPYEQTWMSHMFQLTKSGSLYPGILLMTPTEHNRFEHYDGKLRKES